MGSMQSNLHGLRMAKRRRIIMNHHRRPDEEGETHPSTPAACPLVAGRRSWVEADPFFAEGIGEEKKEKKKNNETSRTSPSFLPLFQKCPPTFYTKNKSET